jgi:hypothetical protein
MKPSSLTNSYQTRTNSNPFIATISTTLNYSHLQGFQPNDNHQQQHHPTKLPITTKDYQEKEQPLNERENKIKVNLKNIKEKLESILLVLTPSPNNSISSENHSPKTYQLSIHFNIDSTKFRPLSTKSKWITLQKLKSNKLTPNSPKTATKNKLAKCSGKWP